MDLRTEQDSETNLEKWVYYETLL